MYSNFVNLEPALLELMHGEDRVESIPAPLLNAATYHGVTPLLYRSLQDRARSAGETIRGLSRLRRLALEEAALEAGRRHETTRVVDALSESGVRCLLIKGTPLAYSVYPSPELRPRVDVDLLIKPGERDATIATFARLGYWPATVPGGQLERQQRNFVSSNVPPKALLFDVHWQISNRPRYWGTFELDQLLARSVPLPGLGEAARGPSVADALTLACIHLLGHHAHEPRLIWLYDIYLLTRKLGRESEDQAWLASVVAQGVVKECLMAVRAALCAFGQPGEDELVERLRGATDGDPAFVVPTNRIAVWLADAAALPSWRARAIFLFEYLFPGREYMRERYQLRSDLLLPILYINRAVAGLLRVCRHLR